MAHWKTIYIPEIESNKLHNKFEGCTAENAYLMVTRITWSMFLLLKSSVGQIILGLLRIPKFHCRVHNFCRSILPWTRYASTLHATTLSVGWDKEVCTVTRYGPWFESRWGGQIFRFRPGPALGPNQPRVQCVPDLFPGGKAAGAWRWQPNPI
jgi:hypothetical protein